MLFDPTEVQYRRWQTQLQQHNLFRLWWQFWSNYAFVFFVLAAVLLWQQRNAYEILVLVSISFVAARGLLTTLINIWYHRVRPYQRFNFTPITSRFFSLQTKLHNSFPSRHTTAFTSIAVVVWFFNPVVGLLLLIATLMTGVGRVILGFHYTTDIAAGVVFGTILGIATVLIGTGLLFTGGM